MNAVKSLVPQNTRRLPQVLPVQQQEREILALGQLRHWDFRVLGVAPVPPTAIYIKNWWIVPLHEDTSTIPAAALERVHALYEAGIRPKAFVIAHEAPPQLAPPKGTRIVSPFEYWSKRAVETTVNSLKVTGKVVAVAAPIVLSVLGTTLLLSLTAAGTLIDPKLIAITADGDVWIELLSWDV